MATQSSQKSLVVWLLHSFISISRASEHRLEHIGTQHFGSVQSMSDWDFTKVIQGLLLQSETRDAWHRLVDSCDPFHRSKISWINLGSENLQDRLEQGLTLEQPPQALAQAAYDNAEHEWSLAQHDEMAYSSTTATPIQCYGICLSLPFRHHEATSREASLQCQPYSSPQHQASEIPRSLPVSKTQTAYEAAVYDSSPAQLAALNHSPGWEPMALDTNDKITPQPTTPYNDTDFYPTDPPVYDPWDGNSKTSNLRPIDGMS